MVATARSAKVLLVGKDVPARPARHARPPPRPVPCAGGRAPGLVGGAARLGQQGREAGHVRQQAPTACGGRPGGPRLRAFSASATAACRPAASVRAAAAASSLARAAAATRLASPRSASASRSARPASARSLARLPSWEAISDFSTSTWGGGGGEAHNSPQPQPLHSTESPPSHHTYPRAFHMAHPSSGCRVALAWWFSTLSRRRISCTSSCASTSARLAALRSPRTPSYSSACWRSRASPSVHERSGHGLLKSDRRAPGGSHHLNPKP